MDTRFAKARSLVRSVKKTYGDALLKQRNVVGLAFGRRIAHGEVTDEPAMVIYVMRKVPKNIIAPNQLLPRQFYLGGDKIDVDVVETGPIFPLAFTARERPSPSGISIGHPDVTAGTLGCLVMDNTDNRLCILSNNHVMANQNAALLGDPIIQPGSYDGGTNPADDIATLKRFVTINATGNTVDGAIAELRNPGDALNQMKNNLMQPPGPDHPAVGLLFAGSCNRTIMNPIRDVMAQLNIRFPNGLNSFIPAELDMNVEKVGRTTEYTTSTVLELDVTVTIDYDFGSATFENQFATAWMSDGGDSGSIVCRGGAGGNEDRCGCLSTSAASSVVGTDLRLEQAGAFELRDKYIRHTRIGHYLVDAFYLNEEQLVERVSKLSIESADRQFAKKMYEKYKDDARRLASKPQSLELRLTDEHLQDAEVALKLASRYMDREEQKVAEELLQLARQAKGKNFTEVLSMLDDEKLFEKVVALLSRLESVVLPKPPKKGRRGEWPSVPG